MAKNRSLFFPILTVGMAMVIGLIALPQSLRSKVPLFNRASIHYGLDLAGGTQLDFRISEQEMIDQRTALDERISQLEREGAPSDKIVLLQNERSALEEQQRNILEAIRTVLERRINSLGVSEATITPSTIGSEKHLLVECPGVVDVQKCIATVGKTIKLEFKEEFTEATAEYRAGVDRTVAEAQKNLASGTSLAELSEDMSGKLGVVSIGDRLYFRSELPKGLEDLWTMSPTSGVAKRKGVITVPLQDEQGNLSEKDVEGIFLAQVLRAKTATGRTVNEAPVAFGILEKQEKDVRYVSHTKTPLDSAVAPRIAGVLRSMKPGDLQSTTMDDGSSHILFLRLFTPGREEVGVSHLLISYKGALQAKSSVTRSKEEAKALVESLRKQLDAGADFAALAKANSEGDSAAQGGRLGSLSRGSMPASFDAVAFEQKPGAVSAPVETPYGFHIIKTETAVTTSLDVVNYEELVIANDANGGRATELLSMLQSGNVRTIEDAVRIQAIFFSYEPTGWKDTTLDGKHFRSATVTLDPTTNVPVVQIVFDEEGGKVFQELTKRNVGKRIAIFVGGDLISAPVVQGEIAGGTAIISGSRNFDDARTLAQDLNTGAIPAPIFLAGQRTVEATLGASALKTSMQAGVVGIILLMVYMLLIYRLLGVLADFALIVYAVIYFAMMKVPLFLFSGQYVVLTLAGMAGIILSVGMAIDANVLIFERIKEEMRKGRHFSSALETGFEKAWPSIRDGNVSTLITCAILFIIGTSIVRGFAITLGLGVFLSMFTAIIVTRWMARKIASTPLAERTELFGVKRIPHEAVQQ